MAEKQDLDLQEESGRQQQGSGVAGEKTASVEADPPPAGDRPRSSLPRVLLLLLLLVGLGAAAFYYFSAVPQSSAPTAAMKPQRQPIPIPVPPAPAAPKVAETPEPQQPAAVPALNEKPAGPDAVRNESASELSAIKNAAQPVQVPRGVLKEVLPVEEESVVPGGEDAPENPAPGQRAPAPAPVAVAKKDLAPQKRAVAADQDNGQPAEDPLAGIAVGHYMVEAGVFLQKKHFEEARLTLEKLGFEPRALKMEKEMEMNRLWVGTFEPEEARRRYRDLKVIAPDAFLLPEGDQLAVFAGSYPGLDEARAQADFLYRKNVQVTEQKARVRVPLTRLNFGDFSKLAEAQKAAGRAEAAGLSTYVLKKR